MAILSLAKFSRQTRQFFPNGQSGPNGHLTPQMAIWAVRQTRPKLIVRLSLNLIAPRTTYHCSSWSDVIGVRKIALIGRLYAESLQSQGRRIQPKMAKVRVRLSR